MSNNTDYKIIKPIIDILNYKASSSEGLQSLRNNSDVAEFKMSLKESSKASFELKKDQFSINFNENKMIISDDIIKIDFLEIKNQLIIGNETIMIDSYFTSTNIITNELESDEITIKIINAESISTKEVLIDNNITLNSIATTSINVCNIYGKNNILKITGDIITIGDKILIYF
jgi:hypothetical protein